MSRVYSCPSPSRPAHGWQLWLALSSEPPKFARRFRHGRRPAVGIPSATAAAVATSARVEGALAAGATRSFAATGCCAALPAAMARATVPRCRRFPALGHFAASAAAVRYHAAVSTAITQLVERRPVLWCQLWPGCCPRLEPLVENVRARLVLPLTLGLPLTLPSQGPRAR